MPRSKTALDADRLLRAVDPERRRGTDAVADAALLERVRMVVDQRREVQAPPSPPAVRSGGDRRWGRVLLGAPAAGLVAAVVIAVAVGGPGADDEGPAEGRAGTGVPGISGTVQVRPGDGPDAPVLLERIATAALSRPALIPGPEQFVYVRSQEAFTEPTQEGTMDGPGRMQAVSERQVWLPQDPAHATGLIRGRRGDVVLHTGTDDPARYAALAALPTDPVRLLAQIRATTAGQAGGPDYAAFDWIGELLKESIAPPPVSAALFRAAALIPGVQAVPDAVDAAGRHGVGIAIVSAGQRFEWIFDPHDYAYLGERDYLVEDTTLGPAGMLFGISAVLERGITDEAGDRPDAQHTVR